MKQAKKYQHQHYAHCESGAVSALLKHEGLDLSEPMIFGITGGLSYAFIPFLKAGNLPVVSYRMFPGTMIKNLQKRLGINIFKKTYKNKTQAMNDLSKFAKEGRPVGIQTSVYFLTYFPPDMRFQFNAHNCVVMGRENDEFLMSDPVFESIQRIKSKDLEKARFAKGLSSPKGVVWHPVSIPETIDFEKVIKKSIKETVGMMLYTPVPIIGIKGINYLARYIEKIKRKKSNKYLRLFLGQVIRMQEEIGTGGGGFRFMYAAFLQEAGKLLNNPLLDKASGKMSDAGNSWRQFALSAAKGIKNRTGDIDILPITTLLRKCGEKEKEVYLILKKLK